MSEKELTEKTAEVLSKFFDVAIDKIYCDCRKCRFDMVLTCKKTQAKFIIEMKKNERKRGNPLAEHIDQAMRYRLHKIDGKCYPVLVAPGYSYKSIRAVKSLHPDDKRYSIDIHTDEHHHHTFNGFLGHFGVGEIRRRRFKPTDYYMFIFNNYELYSCNSNKYGSTGLHEKNYINIFNRLNQWPLLHTSEILQNSNLIMCESSKPSPASATEQSAI